MKCPFRDETNCVGPALAAGPSRGAPDNRDGLPASGSPTSGSKANSTQFDRELELTTEVAADSRRNSSL